MSLIKPAGYEELAPRATELKRMLTTLMQKLKLTADRCQNIQIFLASRAATASERMRNYFCRRL